MKVKYLYVLAIVAALMMAACGKNDSDLQKAASSKLAADNVSGVTVAVKDGNATLTGEVADITVKTKAEASVKGVEGIKSVDASGLKLKPLPPAPTPMGAQVTATARYAGREGKLFLFEVSVADPAGEVGSGWHKRAIVSNERLQQGAAKRVG